MNYVWKILDIYADGEKITSARYYCSVDNGQDKVETEGNATFEGDATTPLSKVTEQMVAKWVEAAYTVDGECSIKKRLAEQLLSVQSAKIEAPWKPVVFTVKL